VGELEVEAAQQIGVEQVLHRAHPEEQPDPPGAALVEQVEQTDRATAIRKQKHKDRYGRAARNPYDLAFTFALERLLPLLEGLGQTDVQLIAEARGRREDAELRLAFLMNVIGIQMADLAGYPVARYVLNPARPSEAFNVLRAKFYKGPGWVQGLKIFP